MKVNGKKVERNLEYVVLPRNDGDIVFKCIAVTDYTDFEKLCPAPKPPQKMMKGGAKVDDVEDPSYKLELIAYGTKRMNWMILSSLRATEIEWDTVNFADANTWDNWEKDLRASGFSDVEMQRIFKGVMDANCLNEVRLKEARDRFLAGIQEGSDLLSSRLPEHTSTQSIAVVNVLDSNHQT